MANIVAMLIILVVFGTVWFVVGSAFSYKRHKLLIETQSAHQLESGLAALRRSDAKFLTARGLGQTLALFQLPDGSTVELPVADSEATSFTPGETGILEWQGNRYIRFETFR